MEDSFVNVKVNNYNKKCKHIRTKIDRMYLFKQDTLRDRGIDAIKIDQWRQILNKYKESLKKITTPKHEKKIDIKIIQEQINLLMNQKTIYLNFPSYKFNKKKHNYLLNIWKHETGIKSNFDL